MEKPPLQTLKKTRALRIEVGTRRAIPIDQEKQSVFEAESQLEKLPEAGEGDSLGRRELSAYEGQLK